MTLNEVEPNSQTLLQKWRTRGFHDRWVNAPKQLGTFLPQGACSLGRTMLLHHLNNFNINVNCVVHLGSPYSCRDAPYSSRQDRHRTKPSGNTPSAEASSTATNNLTFTEHAPNIVKRHKKGPTYKRP